MTFRSILIVTLALSGLFGCTQSAEPNTDVVEEAQKQSAPTVTSTNDEAPATSDQDDAEGDAEGDTEGDTEGAAQQDGMPEAEQISMASDALQQFGTLLYKQLYVDHENDNLAISPWSIESALVMTAAGAKGNTLAQMLYSLGFVHLADDPFVMQTAFATLSKELLRTAVKAPSAKSSAAQGDDKTPALKAKKGEEKYAQDSADTERILKAANAIWVAEQLRDNLQEKFRKTLQDVHNAEVHNAPFKTDADGARQTINRWVATHTDDKIPNLLAPGTVDGLTSIVLTNAIAFDADWTFPFQKRDTRDAPFFLLDGEQVDVKLMKQRLRHGSYWEGEHYVAVALPYEAGNYAMSIVVPQKGHFAQVRDSFFENGYAHIFASTANRRTEIVNVFLPRFKFRWSNSLVTSLKALGMENAFDNRADFSQMFESESHRISDVIHKVYIDVDEEGTEAAAATGTIVATTSMRGEPPIEYDVRADRPFLFAIHDTQTNTPVFLGQVTNPVAK